MSYEYPSMVDQGPEDHKPQKERSKLWCALDHESFLFPRMA